MIAERRIDRRGLLASLAIGTGAVIAGGWLTRRGAVAQRMDNPDGTNPMASGTDLMPAVPVCWRLVSYWAKPEAEAPALKRTLNFLMPSTDREVNVFNETTGQSALLVTHVLTGAFGAQNEVQTRYTTDGEIAPYVAWELVVADLVDDPATIGDATLIDRTEPFTAPRGSQEIELVNLALSDGGPTKVIPRMDDHYPMLGFVHSQPLLATDPDGTTRLWDVKTTHLVRPGDRLAYAGAEPNANGFVVFPRFAVQRSY